MKSAEGRIENPDCPKCGRRYGRRVGCKIIEVYLEKPGSYKTTIFCPRCKITWITIQHCTNGYLSTPDGLIPEHRWIWEHYNGPIPNKAIIHHLNGNRMDNRIENLVCISKETHSSMHSRVANSSIYILALQKRIVSLEAELAKLRND